MTDLKVSRLVTTNDIHEFLWTKGNSRHIVTQDQKALAAEFRVDHDKFNRLVKQLVCEGKLKIVSVGMRGLKTFKVSDPET